MQNSNFLLLIFFSFLSVSCNVQSACFFKSSTPLSDTRPECDNDEATILREIVNLEKEMRRINRRWLKSKRNLSILDVDEPSESSGEDQDITRQAEKIISDGNNLISMLEQAISASE